MKSQSQMPARNLGKPAPPMKGNGTVKPAPPMKPVKPYNRGSGGRMYNGSGSVP